MIKGDPKLYAEYDGNFQKHLKHSERYEVKASKGEK